VAVVFTDLVGSTALASELGPAGAERLRQAHFAVLRAALSATGGVEVKNLGDGLMAAYDGASAAMDGAVAMQQGVFGHNRTAEVELAIRVGVAIGEVVEDNDDFFGEPVVEAARLCAAAEGGQILATEFIAGLGRRSGHELVPVGVLELKGLPEPVAAVEVRWTPPEKPAGGGRVPLPSRLDAGSGIAGFVGRAEELGLLDGALKEAGVQRQRRLVLIGGEPGIGKTTMASVFARSAHADGSVVLYGRCDEDLGIPYQPWAEAVAYLFDHGSPGLLDEVVAAHGADLARLGPGLAHLAAGAGGGSADPETARYLLFGAVLRILGAAGANRPVVVVLDDLQWADAQTLQLLRFLVGSDRPLQVVLVATFRESDLTADHPLSEVLAWLHRQIGVSRISLRGLGDVELLALMEAGAGHSVSEEGIALRDALARETDGNPFFVGELLRHLAETGAVYQDADGRWTADGDVREHGLPISVREVIGQRVTRLGAEAERVLSIAAVIGRDFELGVLASASDTSEDALLDVLDAASAATLVVNVSGDRYSFAHALVEHALYDGLAPARRTRAHRRVAEAIEEACGADPGPRVGELAYHFAQATTPADATKAIAYARAAGDRALAQLAPADAVRWYEHALSLLDQQPADDQRLRAALLVGLGSAQRQTGDPSFRETLLAAGHLAKHVGDADTLVAAALTNNRVYSSSVGRVDADRVGMIEAALAAVGEADSPSRARLLSLLALERTWEGDYPGRRAVSDQALAMARRVGDPATLLDVLLYNCSTIYVPDTLSERLAITAEAEAIADRIGDPIGRFWNALNCVRVSIEAADVGAYRRHIQQAVDLADAIGQPRLRWNATWNRAMRALLAGDTEQAEALAERVLDMTTETGEPDAPLIYGALFSGVRWHRGRDSELLDMTAGAFVDNPGLSAYRGALARMYADAGRDGEARQLLAAETRSGFSLPNDETLLGALLAWAEAAARVDDRVAAGLVYSRLAPWPASVPPATPFYGVGAHYLGQLATTLGRYDTADAHFTQALALNQGLEAPFPVARTHLEWGRMLIARGRPDDGQAARVHLESALDLARRYGCALVEQRALDLLGQL